jgi:hypothetical protein
VSLSYYNPKFPIVMPLVQPVRLTSSSQPFVLASASGAAAAVLPSRPVLLLPMLLVPSVVARPFSLVRLLPTAAGLDEQVHRRPLPYAKALALCRENRELETHIAICKSPLLDLCLDPQDPSMTLLLRFNLFLLALSSHRRKLANPQCSLIRSAKAKVFPMEQIYN